MEVELITIGDEILIGQTIDTNSAWMAKQLIQIGLKISVITSIKDEHSEIIKALHAAEGRAPLVLMTGGLGPTKDDITKIALCDYFKTELVRNAEVLKRIEQYFSDRGRPILESNREQADLPKACTILSNTLGTASGMWFERGNTIFVSMPGVPYEMKGIMESEVIPRVEKRFSLPALYHKTIMTEGIGESFLAEIIAEWEESLIEENIKIAYLPSPGIVKIRLSAEGGNQIELLQSKVNRKADELKQLVPQYIFGEDDISMQKAIGNLLLQHKKTISAAESCTGGYISHLLTSISGSSEYFLGSVISYSNEAKVKLLNVKREDIEEFGAVSEQVVKQMAVGARAHLGSDFALATSGIAGPDGGSEEKPVGTVWIAIAGEEGVYAKRFLFEKNRQRNIQRASYAALSMIRRVFTK